MSRPDFFSKYLPNWELFNVLLGGKSALDAPYFIGRQFSQDRLQALLKGYGISVDDMVAQAELFGNFQEAIQFIKRYFLKEGNPEGVDFIIPDSILRLTDINELFKMAIKNEEDEECEERLWAEVILKVMHTILHVDKDLRGNYFPVVQTQIFDRFYAHVHRDEDNKLFLGKEEGSERIELVDFETKAKKSRDSVIIKLLHKVENVAEELFDRVGVRFVTKSELDALRVLSYLVNHSVITPHNIVPSRSQNTLVNLQEYKLRSNKIVKLALRNELSEERFYQALEREAQECPIDGPNNSKRNKHSKSSYRAIQLTARFLIRFRNPFISELNKVREFSRKVEGLNEAGEDLKKRILGMDASSIARDIRFFYPSEIQIVDQKSHQQNTEGEASHVEYKKSQVQSALKRVLAPLISYHEQA